MGFFTAFCRTFEFFILDNHEEPLLKSTEKSALYISKVHIIDILFSLESCNLTIRTKAY